MTKRNTDIGKAMQDKISRRTNNRECQLDQLLLQLDGLLSVGLDGCRAFPSENIDIRIYKCIYYDNVCKL